MLPLKETKPHIPKEAPMYKTIVLELIQQHPDLHDQLCRNRQLLPTLERVAKALRHRHESWKLHLSKVEPQSDPSQIASEALEIALKELEDCLPTGFPPDDSEPLSLEAAMAYVRNHTPPA
jgi:hypothetical protein